MGAKLELAYQDLHATILPEYGGRLENLYFRQQALLTDRTVHAENWGATFWPSPQASWGWPPLTAIDSQAYQVLSRSRTQVQLMSPPSELSGVPFQLKKSFRCSEHQGLHLFDAEYELSSLGPGNLSLACWEISRVAGSGISFFEMGDILIESVAPHQPLKAQAKGDFLFYDHAQLHTGVARKVHAHTRGCFLAHLQLTPSPRILLKVFAPLSKEQQAPGEGVVEIFYNGCGGYIELEVQGAYQPLAINGGPQLHVRTLVLEPTENLNLEDLESLAHWVKSIAVQLNQGSVL